MKVTLKSPKIWFPGSAHHGKSLDVIIDKGKILDIGKGLKEAGRVFEARGMWLTPGWVDMQANLCDPGYEQTEDLASGATAAAAGGFTAVAVMPNTRPATDTKNQVHYIKGENPTRLTQLHPVGAVTVECKGEDLTEMIDLHTAGAIAFSDGMVPVWHTDIVLKTLQYLQKFNGLLIQRPEDLRLNLFGTMHEGMSSTRLGLKGMPVLSEEIMVARDLQLLEYAGGRIHFSNVSSIGALERIKKARKSGMNVTCDMAIHQLSFTDDDLHDFDTVFKVNPPFRDKNTNKKILSYLEDGTIDVLVSSHQPQDEEHKKMEFDLAEFGATGLQTAVHHLVRLSDKVDMETLLEKLTLKPREILGLEMPTLEKGAMADLTLFDPKGKWKLDHATNKSQSRNNPLWEKPVNGKVMAVFGNGQQMLNF